MGSYLYDLFKKNVLPKILFNFILIRLNSSSTEGKMFITFALLIFKKTLHFYRFMIIFPRAWTAHYLIDIIVSTNESTLI